MKRSQVNEILVDQANRMRRIISNTAIIAGILLLAIVSFIVHYNVNKTIYVEYTEKSNLDYNVYLKNNEFFKEDYLGKDKQYIASLIDYIKANFDYKLEVEDNDIEYKYSYKIVAEVNVKDKDNGYSLYSYEEDLVPEQVHTTSSNTSVSINKELDINYNKYNGLITRFVSVYDLEDAISSLDIKMYVKVFGECEELEEVSKNSVISLSIPLTTKTVAVDMTYDLVDADKENVMACKDKDGHNVIFLIIGVILIMVDLYLVIRLGEFVIVTRTAENIYEKELKKILNNYKSYIQKINNEFDLSGYQVMKVDTFTDMLEIRDTTQEPILMVENKEKNSSYFVIPSKNKIIYMYGLKVSEIKKQMENKNNEDIK